MTGRAGLTVKQANLADARRVRNVKATLLADLPWRSVRLPRRRKKALSGLIGKLMAD
jgi:hypothetical protein